VLTIPGNKSFPGLGRALSAPHGNNRTPLPFRRGHPRTAKYGSAVAHDAYLNKITVRQRIPGCIPHHS